MIDAIVVLPEHLHTVMTLPPNDNDFSWRWQRIKGAFTRRVAAGIQLEPDRRGEYGLWQGRFWEHTIRDDDDWAKHVDYIHYNPIKHGLEACGRLAVFVVSSICATLMGATRLGWHG